MTSMNTKVASQLLDKVTSFVKDNPSLVNNMMLGGGAGALGGAIMTGDGDPDETATERVTRRVKNALIGGALGAGAAGALDRGFSTMANALPKDDISPEMQAVTSGPARALSVATLGGSGIAAKKALQKAHANTVLGYLRDATVPVLNSQGNPTGRTKKVFEDVLHSADGKNAAAELKRIMRNKGADMEDAVYDTLVKAFGGKAEGHAKASELLNKAGIQLGDKGIVGRTHAQGFHRQLKHLFGSKLGSKLFGSKSPKVAAGLAKVLSHGSRNAIPYSLAAAGLVAPELLGSAYHQLVDASQSSVMG